MLFNVLQCFVSMTQYNDSVLGNVRIYIVVEPVEIHASALFQTPEIVPYIGGVRGLAST